MKRGTYGYKRFSIEPRWSHSDILKSDRDTIIAYYQILQNSLLPVRLRYKQNEERYMRVQTILYRMALLKLKYLKVGFWPFFNHFVFVYPLRYKRNEEWYKQVQTKYKRSMVLIFSFCKVGFQVHKTKDQLCYLGAYCR